MDDKKLEDLSGLDWMVRARNEIQLLMLDLYKSRSSVSVDSGGAATRELKHWNLMLGVAFSLWRAVFLVDGADLDRTSGELAEDGEKFLKRVIETNMIGFADDLRLSTWSSGYYLNNARFRLSKLATDYPNIVLREGISNARLKDVWYESFAAMKDAFDMFKKNLKPGN